MPTKQTNDWTNSLGLLRITQRLRDGCQQARYDERGHRVRSFNNRSKTTAAVNCSDWLERL
jgi:hypothetical protein